MNIPVREWLWPNWITFVTTLLVLAFTYYLFRKHLYEPTRKFMKKRTDFIDKNIKDSATAKADAAKALDDAKAHFDQAIKESSQYLDKQMQAANKKAQKLVEDTKLDMTQLKTTTKEALDNAQVEARKNLKKEVATISMAAAAKILEKEIDAKDSEKLVDEFIKEIK